jgi:hypothetical protein
VTEASPEDVAEQAATPVRDSPAPAVPDLPLEANEADAAEQALVVELDEDDDR